MLSLLISISNPTVAQTGSTPAAALHATLVRLAGCCLLAVGLAAMPGGAEPARAEDLHAEKVYAWEFQRSEDRNLDQWPDGWRRRAGRNYPAYIPIRIAPRDPATARAAREAEPTLSRLWMKYQSRNYFKNFIPESTPEPIANFLDRFLVNSCLTIDMDGGAVQLESPAFQLDARFTYTLDASLATRGLDGHQTWIELLLLDDKGAVISSSKSSVSTGTTDWHLIATGSQSSEAMRMGQVVLHIQPLKSPRLTGSVYLDEVRLYRLPKLELTVDAPHHVVTPDQNVDITCSVLGIADARSTVNFKLYNHFGQLIDQTNAVLSPALPQPPSGLSSAPTAQSTSNNSVASSAINATSPTNLSGSNPNPTSPFATPTIAEPTASNASNDQRGNQVGIEPRKSSEVPKGVKLTTVVPDQTRRSANDKSLGAPGEAAQQLLNRQRLDAVAHWRLNVREPGYYRVVVDLGRTSLNSDGRQISREVSLAVLESSKAGVGGPFGWSLPEFNSQFTPESVPDLVKLAGVGWLKLPVWFAPGDTKMAERLSVLLERLDLRKVHCVGILDRPLAPGTLPANRPMAASIFGTPTDWEPELEPILTRMSMKLSWFQLGSDRDRSFIGNPNLVPMITDIRNRMQTYSQELQLALTWDYQDPIPGDRNLPWQASQMSSEPQLTARELRSYLSTNDHPEHARWITLNPLPASRYRSLDRARDMAERMVAIKEKHVTAAFVTTLLDRETGIFNPDGSAGELFLPWRILNQSLAAATYLGSITMPGGSTNYVFGEGQTGFMILWNDRTAEEKLYLGDKIRVTDLWGKTWPVEETTSDRNTPEQKILVTPWPILVRGVSVPVATWRMQFNLENKTLPSLLSMRTELPISVQNTLHQSAYGTVNLVAPTLLQPGPANMRIQLNEGSTQRLQLPIPVRNDASAGKHALRFDFSLSGDQQYDFSAYDSLTLGIGDVELLWEAIDVNAQRAALRVELTNSTNRPVSFDCKLFPPQKPYRRFQIKDALPGSTQRDLVLPLDGVPEDAVIWIRCEEIGTGRVLNYRLPLR